MLFSVVIALYNKERYIEATLRSVLAQRHGDFEVVVVDDGSTDAGAALVEAFADPRIRLVRQANGGVARARNRGIDAARGELVCFLDADDWYGPGYLEYLAAQRRRYPSGAFYASGYRRVVEGADARLDGEDGGVGAGAPVADFYGHIERHGVPFCTNSVAIPRAELQAMQPCFVPGDSFGEDLDLWFRVGERLRLVFSPAQLVGYRIGVADSLCARNNMATLPAAFARLEQRAPALAPPTRRSALRIAAHARVGVARYALAQGRRLDALAELSRARQGGVTARWCVTLLMCLVGNGNVLNRWEVWRGRSAGP